MQTTTHDEAFRRVAARLDPTALRRLSRADKWRACAALLVPDYAMHTAAITVLMRPCAGGVDCSMGLEALTRSGLAALGRSVGRANQDSLDAEYRRLFGNGGGPPVRPLPLVPACACNYLSGESDGSLDDVLALYDEARFDDHLACDRCPGHIATELEFLAHCLTRAGSGDADALRVTRDFVVSHLFPWGAVFAAATLSRSRHPVTMFAAEALEHLLFCELSEARALE